MCEAINRAFAKNINPPSGINCLSNELPLVVRTIAMPQPSWKDGSMEIGSLVEKLRPAEAASNLAQLGLFLPPGVSWGF